MSALGPAGTAPVLDQSLQIGFWLALQSAGQTSVGLAQLGPGQIGFDRFADLVVVDLDNLALAVVPGSYQSFGSQ